MGRCRARGSWGSRGGCTRRGRRGRRWSRCRSWLGGGDGLRLIGVTRRDDDGLAASTLGLDGQDDLAGHAGLRVGGGVDEPVPRALVAFAEPAVDLGVVAPAEGAGCVDGLGVDLGWSGVTGWG